MSIRKEKIRRIYVPTMFEKKCRGCWHKTIRISTISTQENPGDGPFLFFCRLCFRLHQTTTIPRSRLSFVFYLRYFGAIIPIDANWPKKRKKNFVSFSFEKTNKRDRLCIYLKCLYYLLRLLRTILYYYARYIRSPRLYNTMPDWRHIPSWLSATEKNRVYFKLDDGRREENRLQNDCDVDVNIIRIYVNVSGKQQISFWFDYLVFILLFFWGEGEKSFL
jgi:hypothetical protein